MIKKLILVLLLFPVLCTAQTITPNWSVFGAGSHSFSVGFTGQTGGRKTLIDSVNLYLRFVQKMDSIANSGYATNWKLKKYVPWSYIHTDSQQINIGDSIADNAVLLQLNPIGHNGTLSAGDPGTGAGSQYYFGSDELSFNYFDGTYNQSISMPGGVQPITINNDNNRGIAYGVHPIFYDPLQVVDKKYADSIANADTAAIFHNNNQWYGNNTYHGTTIQILGGNLTLTKTSTGTGFVSADGVSTNYLSLTGSSQGYIDLNGATDPNQHWEIGRGPTQGFSFESALGLWHYRFDNSTGNWNLTGGSLGSSTVRTLDTRDIPSGGFIGPSDTTVFARSRTAADSNKVMFLDLNGKAEYNSNLVYRQGVNSDLTLYNRFQLGSSSNIQLLNKEAGMILLGRDNQILPRVAVVGYGDGLSRRKATFAMWTVGGTVDSPTAALAGTIIGQPYWAGYDGVSAFREGLSLVGIAASDMSPTNAAMDLHIKTSPTGSITPIDAMVVDHNQAVTIPAIVANRAMITNSIHTLAASTTTDTELGYVSGVTSAIQTQLNTKFPSAGGTITGNSSITASNGSGLSFTVNNTNATGLGAGYYSITPVADWYNGILGSPGATNYSIYDVTHSLARLTVSNAGVIGIPGLTASQAVFTDASKNLVSNAITGSGSVVMSTSPVLTTPNIGAATGTSLSTSGSMLSGGGFYSATAATFGTNFGVMGGNAVFATSNSTPLLSWGASNVQSRVFLGSSSTSALTANNGYSNLLIGGSPITVAVTGTQPYLSTGMFIKLGTVTNSSAIPITNTSTIVGYGASTAGTNNYVGFFYNDQTAGTTNSWFKYGVTRVSALQIDSLKTGVAGTDAIAVIQGGQVGSISATSFPTIKASANLTAQSAAGNITTFTVGAATATFNVSAYINVTAVATDVIQAQVTYTDENNTAQTVSFTTLSTVSNSTYSPITIRAKNATVITLKTNLTTGIGTITFDAGGTIIQN